MKFASSAIRFGVVQLTANWVFWSKRITLGAIFTLYDTIISFHRRRVADVCSHKYFASQIRHNSHSELVMAADSLAVLHCRMASGPL